MRILHGSAPDSSSLQRTPQSGLNQVRTWHASARTLLASTADAPRRRSPGPARRSVPARLLATSVWRRKTSSGPSESGRRPCVHPPS